MLVSSGVPGTATSRGFEPGWGRDDLRAIAVAEIVTTTSTTFRPDYHLYLLRNAIVCEGLQNALVRLKSLCPKGLQASRQFGRVSFPSWTSRVRIPSPALDVNLAESWI